MTHPYTDLKEAAMKATPGPWKWWTSNSWMRLKHDSRGLTLNVLEPYVCRDGHPDISISADDAAFIALANPARILSLIEGEERMREALAADNATLRLYMGELSAQEIRAVRAAFNWVLARAALKEKS